MTNFMINHPLIFVKLTSIVVCCIGLDVLYQELPFGSVGVGERVVPKCRKSVGKLKVRCRSLLFVRHMDGSKWSVFRLVVGNGSPTSPGKGVSSGV